MSRKAKKEFADEMLDDDGEDYAPPVFLKKIKAVPFVTVVGKSSINPPKQIFSHGLLAETVQQDDKGLFIAVPSSGETVWRIYRPQVTWQFSRKFINVSIEDFSLIYNKCPGAVEEEEVSYFNQGDSVVVDLKHPDDYIKVGIECNDDDEDELDDEVWPFHGKTSMHDDPHLPTITNTVFMPEKRRPRMRPAKPGKTLSELLKENGLK